jgi:pyridoxine kinase
LTDVKINSEADALAAIEKMHSYGPKTVVLKSAFYGESDKIYIIASHKESADAPAQRFRMHVTKLPLYFTGTGDLFSSLTLAYSTRMPMLEAIHRTVSAIQAVLQRSKDGPGKLKEIKLIQSREDLLNPKLVDTMEKL